MILEKLYSEGAMIRMGSEEMGDKCFRKELDPVIINQTSIKPFKNEISSMLISLIGPSIFASF